MISLKTMRITGNPVFEMYLLSDSRIKKLLREFSFYNTRFYREERVHTLTVCLDYPKGNMYWYIDFKRAIETDILEKDVRYESNWKELLYKLKKDIKSDFNTFKSKLTSITRKDVVETMSKMHLRDYQAYDFLQLVIKMNETPECPSGLILSEQRTGKTRIALSAAKHFLKNGDNVVIVAPKSACAGWVSEIDTINSLDLIPTFDAIVIKHTKELGMFNEFRQDKINIRIISYGLFRRFTYAQLRKLYSTKYSNKIMFIEDEVHILRNFTSVQSETSFDFKKGCLKDKLDLHIIGITGTPGVTNSTNIFGLFGFINTSKIKFKNTQEAFDLFKEYFYNCEDTSYGKICKTLKRTAEMNYLIQISAIQTKKRDLDLFKGYSKVYKKYILKMDEKQREIYDEVKDTMEYGKDIDCKNGLVQLTRLQQICVDPSGLVASYELTPPKIKWTLEFIRKNINHKGIVFSKKLQPLKTLQEILTKEGIGFVCMSGSYTLTERMNNIKLFRTNPNIKIFIIQTDTGREGLTLPEAEYTIFLDREYAQGFNEQAEERMTPIDGAPVTKYVIDLIMDYSIEENIYDILVNRKKDIVTINDVFNYERKEDGT